MQQTQMTSIQYTRKSENKFDSDEKWYVFGIQVYNPLMERNLLKERR